MHSRTDMLKDSFEKKKKIRRACWTPYVKSQGLKGHRELCSGCGGHHSDTFLFMAHDESHTHGALPMSPACQAPHSIL